MAGVSRVCTGSSNNPDIVRYTPFLPLKRRTISLRIAWGEPLILAKHTKLLMWLALLYFNDVSSINARV
jgi:hypothetical protein